MVQSVLDSIETQQPEELLEALVGSGSSDGRCGGPWAHELTAVVKHCAVVLSEPGPVLQVNPAWLTELIERDELELLVAEMRTWHLLNSARVAPDSRDRNCPAA